MDTRASTANPSSVLPVLIALLMNSSWGRWAPIIQQLDANVLAAPVTVVDEDGPDDEPGQKDLTQLTIDYDSAPGVVSSPGTGLETHQRHADHLDALFAAATSTTTCSSTSRCARSRSGTPPSRAPAVRGRTPAGMTASRSLFTNRSSVSRLDSTSAPSVWASTRSMAARTRPHPAPSSCRTSPAGLQTRSWSTSAPIPRRFHTPIRQDCVLVPRTAS